ncbi:hypothetical protein MMC25_001237 [Agyrium rufum]|nr:hypothetical protein [Agyrium rufum]
MGFPPPPVANIDWSNLGFRVREVNGHIESHYAAGKWSAPEFVASPHLSIHGMSPVLNYGQSAFEGIKAFRLPSDTSIAIFRPRANAKRLNHSNSFIAIPDVPEEHFMKCIRAAVSLNAEFVPPHETGGAMYIRPLVFGSSAQLGLNPPEEYTFVVFVLPTGVYHGAHPIDALIVEDFDRSAPHGTGSAKVGGNYAPVLPRSEAARKEGFGITLHLDSATREYIDEFSTSGFVGIKYGPEGEKGEKFTLAMPSSKNILKSVTSDSVGEVAKSFGWTVENRPVKYEELGHFDEVCAVGTAAAMVPIKTITMRSKGDKFVYRDGSDEPGPAVSKILATYKGIQTGKAKDPFGWLDIVAAPEEYRFNSKEQDTNGEAGKLVNGSAPRNADQIMS